MCDPVSLAVVSIGTTLASTGLGIAGQAQQAASQQAMHSYQRQVVENNRIAVERLAVDAMELGKVEEQKLRLRTRALMGAQTAALAGQGTNLSGSSLDILGDTAATGEKDALALRDDAAMKAWGYRTKGVEFGNEALLENHRREYSRLGALSLAGSLIGGVGSVAEKWYKFSV